MACVPELRVAPTYPSAREGKPFRCDDAVKRLVRRLICEPQRRRARNQFTGIFKVVKLPRH